MPHIIEMTMGCREQPSSETAASLNILQAWIQENSLFADLAVTNKSSHDILLPSRNVGGHYWDAVLYDAKGEPVVYCGGVSELNLDPFAELIANVDVATVKPGETVTLRRIALAPFWPYLTKPEYDIPSFQVFYTGWSSVAVYVNAAEVERIKERLEAASQRQCNLYGGELQSRRHRLP